MLRGSLLAAAIAFSACGSNPAAPSVPLDRQVTLAPGQSVSIGDSVAVSFLGVQGDSRCPADALCIQGGDALVKLRLTRNHDARDVDLHTGNMLPARVDDLTVALVELSPYPFSSRTIQPDEYRATVRVTR